MAHEYDIVVELSTVADPGNAPIAIDGFTPPNSATVPAQQDNNPGYQVVGGVPYTYQIGQYEITASQYVSFLNAVDPTGDNPIQPWTNTRLYENRFSPIENPEQGQIIRLEHAKNGQHYALSDESWANKPMMWAHFFQYLYFVNALYNGTIVAEQHSKNTSPDGFGVELSKKYVKFSENYRTGMYDLSGEDYAIADRQSTSGFVLPSEDEWIKAAYYANGDAGNGTSYYYYPTATNSQPEPLKSAPWLIENGTHPTKAKIRANVDQFGDVLTDKLDDGVINNRGYVNYNAQVFWEPDYAHPNTQKANVTDVGGAASPSPWLTYDQGGNLVEWTDTSVPPVDAPGFENREGVPVYYKVHGGISNAGAYQLWLTATGTSNPYGQKSGSMFQYSGARVGYLPDKDDDVVPTEGKPSSLADPLTGAGVVTRIDSLSSYDTFYTTDNKTASTTLDQDKSYVFMGAAFREGPEEAKRTVPIYGLFDSKTKTHYYTDSALQSRFMASSERYEGGDVAFYALPPSEGNTKFIRYHNPDTNAYGFSALKGDMEFFTSRGYAIDGVAWSI